MIELVQWIGKGYLMIIVGSVIFFVLSGIVGLLGEFLDWVDRRRRNR